MKGKIYLAGPMSGFPDHNIPAFVEAAQRLRGLGFDVVSPAETEAEQDSLSWEGWMRLDIAILLGCDGVAVLPGWQMSRGACLEVHIAKTLGMPVFCAEVAEPLAAHPMLDSLLSEVVAWANETFPSADPKAKVYHLHKEVCELMQEPTDPEEIADCVILLAHLAAGIGVDLRTAIANKLAKNRLRRWGEPDENGVIEHVRESA